MRLARLLSLLLAILLVGFSLRLLGSAWASAGHADGACPVQAWDEKTGDTQLWWKAITQCNDHPAEEIQYSIFLQRFDWTSWAWGDQVGPIYWEVKTNDWYLGVSRFRNVAAWDGSVCWRVRVHAFVTEWAKGQQADGQVHSRGQCY